MKHNKLGFKRFLGVVVMTLLLSGNLFAEENKADPANGKTLFDQSQCQKCHSTEVFTREDRKVTTLPELESKVRMCDSQLSVNWFDEDIRDVVAYLNQAFYKFEEK